MDDNGEEAVEGAVDDADAELINDILENHIVTGDGLLAKFVYINKFCICIFCTIQRYVCI